jgi:5-hydroxyisourate hydrolase
MSWLTTHVLDTARGLPASGIEVRCEQEREGKYVECAHGITDTDGRLRSLFAANALMEHGNYRLTFETASYFANLKTPTFYPRVEIVFEARAGETHYHVPLLISPFGYSTYRGS